jgi:hypothetical protein
MPKDEGFESKHRQRDDEESAEPVYGVSGDTAREEEQRAEGFARQLKDDGYSPDLVWKKLRKNGVAAGLADAIVDKVFPPKRRRREEESEEYALALKDDGYSPNEVWTKLRKRGIDADLADHIVNRVFPSKRRRRHDDDEEPAAKRKKQRKRKKGRLLLLSIALIVGGAAAVWGLVILFIAVVPRFGLVIFHGGALVAVILLVVGWLMIVSVAFKDDTLYGLLCLFFSPFCLVYAAINWEKTKIPFFVYLFGWIVIIISMTATAVGLRLSPEGRNLLDKKKAQLEYLPVSLKSMAVGGLRCVNSDWEPNDDEYVKIESSSEVRQVRFDSGRKRAEGIFAQTRSPIIEPGVNVLARYRRTIRST